MRAALVCPVTFRSWSALLCAVWCCLGVARAQQLEWRSHQAWSTEEGLPQSSVHAILQSKEGFLWLATEGGAVRYDGVEFRVFRHESDPAFASDDVSAMAEDRSGALWFATADGLVRMEGGVSRRFGEREGLPGPAVTAVAAAGDGTLLVLADDRLLRFDGARFQPVPEAGSPVRALTALPDGGVSLISAGGLREYRNGGVTVSSVSAGMPAGAVIATAEGPDGARWIATEGRVAVSTRAGISTWQTGRDLPGERIASLSIDHEGDALVGTNRGLVVLREDGREVKVNAMGADTVLCSMEDREGNLWIGTETSGLHALRLRAFRAAAGLAQDQVTTIVEASDGAMWIGTRDDGVRRLRRDVVDEPVPTAQLTSAVVVSMAPGNNGDVWVGTPDGLNHIQHGHVTRYTSSDGLPDDFISSLQAEDDGGVWVGTRRGLAHLVDGRVSVITRREGLAGDLVGALTETRAVGKLNSAANRNRSRGGLSDLWIGSLSAVSRLHAGQLTRFAAAKGVPNGIITGIAEDAEGRVWLASRKGGLSYFSDDRFLPVRGRDLPKNVEAMVADGQGSLWLRSRRGVTRVDIADLLACAGGGRCAGMTKAFGTLDGMPNDEVAGEGRPGMWLARSGELWLGTRKGVAITHPGHLPINQVPPPVVIERFQVDDVEAVAGERLPFGHARYTFRYAGLSFTNPAKVRYRFRLDGFDRGWTEAGAQRTAYYTNLSPRRYQFLIEAANNDGVWSTAPAEISFSVLPPFYRRWWFACLVVLAVMLAGALLYFEWVRRLELQFSAVLGERNRMAREVHDTLAQDFVAVSLRLEVVSQLLRREKTGEAAEQLGQTRDMVKAGLAAARQSIWNLRANAAEDSLPTRLTSLAGRSFEENGKATVRIGGEYRALERRLEDEILRIAQEALSNVDRHASAQSVRVDLRYEHDRLMLTVADDGRGFPVSEALAMQDHFGLRGLEERAAAIGAKLTIESALGEGAVVRLAVPLAQQRRPKT